MPTCPTTGCPHTAYQGGHPEDVCGLGESCPLYPTQTEGEAITPWSGRSKRLHKRLNKIAAQLEVEYKDILVNEGPLELVTALRETRDDLLEAINHIPRILL